LLIGNNGDAHIFFFLEDGIVKGSGVDAQEVQKLEKNAIRNCLFMYLCHHKHQPISKCGKSFKKRQVPPSLPVVKMNTIHYDKLAAGKIKLFNIFMLINGIIQFPF
jgi:hypothetical protein